MPNTPVIGAPPGEPVVNFRESAFNAQIERSPRFVWERRGICPCANVNEYHKHADPVCPLCRGIGEYWYGPEDYEVPADMVLTDAQRSVQERNNGAIIRAFMQSAASVYKDSHQLGPWTWGRKLITSRGENKLGHRDRLFLIDDTISYSEIVSSNGATLGTRYRVVDLIELRTIGGRVPLGDYDSDSGDIVFRTAPTDGTRYAVTYLTYPPWIVETFAHMVRTTTSTIGGLQIVQDLAVQAIVGLEFEVEGEAQRRP